MALSDPIFADRFSKGTKMNDKRPPVLLMAKIRQFHSYFALVAAPTIVFFCVTGLLQLFSFHEDHGSYHPPALFEALGSLHKDQDLGGHHEQHPGPPGDPSEAAGHSDAPNAGAMSKDLPPAAPGPSHGPGGFDKTAHWTGAQIVLKAIFALASLSAIVSTVLGAWVGVTFGARRKLLIGLLAAGFVLPTLIVIAGVFKG